MVQLILSLAFAYVIAGMLFAIAFITKGLTVVDPAAKGCTVGFRIIILPATIALWPVLLRKWIHIHGRNS